MVEMMGPDFEKLKEKALRRNSHMANKNVESKSPRFKLAIKERWNLANTVFLNHRQMGWYDEYQQDSLLFF